MSQNNQQRPTPQTDAKFAAVEGLSCLAVVNEIGLFARKLERERDEAREQLEASKIKLEFLASKGITVGILKSSDCPQGQLAYNIQSDSELCDLKHINKVIDAESKLEAMREAIREVYRVLDNALFVYQAITTYAPQNAVDKIENQKHCDNMKTTLTKLQPFLKP